MCVTFYGIGCYITCIKVYVHHVNSPSKCKTVNLSLRDENDINTLFESRDFCTISGFSIKTTSHVTCVNLALFPNNQEIRTYLLNSHRTVNCVNKLRQ